MHMHRMQAKTRAHPKLHHFVCNSEHMKRIHAQLVQDAAYSRMVYWTLMQLVSCTPSSIQQYTAAGKVVIQSEQLLTADAAKQDPNGSGLFNTSPPRATMKRTASRTTYYISQLLCSVYNTSRLLCTPSSCHKWHFWQSWQMSVVAISQRSVYDCAPALYVASHVPGCVTNTSNTTPPESGCPCSNAMHHVNASSGV